MNQAEQDAILTICLMAAFADGGKDDRERVEIKNLTVRDYHRTETAVPVDDIHIESGATVESLQLSDVTLVNQLSAPVNLLHNRGTIGHLALMNVSARAGTPGGCVVKNAGTIRHASQTGVLTDGFEVGL